MKFLAPYILVIPIALIGCSETGEATFEQSKSIPHVQVNSSVKPPLKSHVSKKYAGMSIPQLQAEIIRIKKEIVLLEAEMGSFDDEDSRWDILDGYNENIIELSKAKTTKAKKAADEAKQAADEAKQAADAGQKALNTVLGNEN